MIAFIFGLQGGTVSNRDMKSIQMVIQKLIESDRRHGFDSHLPQSSSAAECVKSGDSHGESKSSLPENGHLKFLD